MSGVSNPQEVDVYVPSNMTTGFSTLQLRLFDRASRALVGGALHDSGRSVDFRESGKTIPGKPTLDVYLGRPPTDLSTYLTVSSLDGLQYPEGGLVEL